MDSCWLSEKPGTIMDLDLLMLSFYPDLTVTAKHTVKAEFIFIIDRSGQISMSSLTRQGLNAKTTHQYCCYLLPWLKNLTTWTLLFCTGFLSSIIFRINIMWILKKSKDLKFCSLWDFKTFDFSTLLTPLQHDKHKGGNHSLIHRTFLIKHGDHCYNYIPVSQILGQFVKKASKCHLSLLEKNM